MAKTTIHWEWDEAFEKFGFGDGDEANFTHIVANYLDSLGYEVDADHWGIHNYMIMSITKDDARYNSGIKVIEFDGYTDPRTILPKKIIAKLDKAFGGAIEV